MSAHTDGGSATGGGAVSLEDVLTLAEAAELVGRPRERLLRRAADGDLSLSVRGGERMVAVRELVRIGWLDGSGQRWELPEKLGLPLLVPLDAEQMLTKREVSELLGVPLNTVNVWIYKGRVESTLFRGWPTGSCGNRERRLISVGALVGKGWLTAGGEPTRVWQTDRRRCGVRQRSIPDDLPTDLCDPRIGIADPEMAALVLVGLSRFLAADGSRRGNGCYQALRLLRSYAHTDVRRAGVVSEAPCPDVDRDLPIPTGTTLVDKLGLPPRYRQEEWARLGDADSVAASFDVNYVAHYVPPALWRVFAALVLDGPELANARLGRVIFAESQRDLEMRRADRDEDAKMAVGTLRASAGKFRRLFTRALVPMRAEGYPSPLLDAWTHVPRAPKIVASSWRADLSAPRRSLLRLAWQQLEADLRTRLAWALRGADNPQPTQDMDDVDILQILRSLPLYRLQRAGVFRLVRNRALLVVFATLGGRLEAIMDLDRRSYRRGFRCPDGELSPAIALRPGKHAPPDEISWKPIPDEQALVLDVYIAVVERQLGAPMPADGPLFIPSFARAGNHMTGHAFSYVIGGANGLLPKPAVGESEVSAGSVTGASRTCGYSPQTLRRAALQLVRHGARSYCERHDLDADPECLAEVLLDHKELRADTMGYADIDTVQGRIRWSKVAIAINWEMLTTDRGARRVPDVRRYRDALELETALGGELNREERELDRLCESRFNAVSPELVVEMMVAFDRIRRIQRSLAEVKETLTTLEHDRDSWRILPDDAPDEKKVDLEAIRRGETGVARSVAPDRARWFLTVAEFAEFAGSAATARRWAAGQLPYGEGDPRNPWQPGSAAVDERLGPRKRRIDVDKINPRYFDTSAKRARRDEILATTPRGFTRQECARPSAPSRDTGATTVLGL